MNYAEAYKTLNEHFGNESLFAVMSRYYDKENFGNFFIEVDGPNGCRSIVCDRGMILVCIDADDLDSCKVALSSLDGSTSKDLIAAIGKLL